MIETLKTEARINLRVMSPFFAPRPARENFGPKLTKSQLQREREREKENQKSTSPSRKETKIRHKETTKCLGNMFWREKEREKERVKKKREDWLLGLSLMTAVCWRRHP